MAEKCDRCSGTGRVSDGNAERAEFIRLDLERWSRWPDFASVAEVDRKSRYADYQDLIAIEKGLFRCFPGGDSLPQCRCEWHDGIPHNGAWRWSFCRGFISTVSCSLENWLAHGKSVVREHPIRPHDGMITDREPTRTTADQWYWQREIDGHATENFSCLIDGNVFGFLIPQWKDQWDQETFRIYPTRDAALISLAEACIRWAR